MEMFAAASFPATLALLGIVIMVSALLSGLVERSGMPQVAVFLAMGASPRSSALSRCCPIL